MQLRSLNQIFLIRKELRKYVVEIQSMIENDPSKLIKDMGVSKFLIRQLVHEDIQYFSSKMRLPISITDHEDHAAKLSDKLKHPLQPTLLWFFSGEKSFCPHQMVYSKTNQYTNNDKNLTSSSHHGVWGGR